MGVRRCSMASTLLLAAATALLPAATAQIQSYPFLSPSPYNFTQLPGYSCAVPVNQLTAAFDSSSAQTITDQFTCEFSGFCWVDWSQVDLLTLTPLGLFTYNNPPNCFQPIQSPVNPTLRAPGTTQLTGSATAFLPQNFTSSEGVCNAGFKVPCLAKDGSTFNTATTCAAAGCCFDNSFLNDATPTGYNQSACFYATTPEPYYTLTNLTQTNATYWSGSLALQGSGGYFGNNFKTLSVSVAYETEQRVRIRVLPANESRYEVPALFVSPTYAASSELNNTQYSVSSSAGSSAVAWIAVTRLSDSVVIFNLTNLQFADLYLRAVTMLPDAGQPALYGFGEREEEEFQIPDNNHSFTLWNADQGANDNTNQYGSHSTYFQILRQSGAGHGVYLKNSNGQEIKVTPTSLTYNVLGGMLDFYVFTGPTPEAATQQYHEVIGLPAVPPYWALGWHQCRYGWPNIEVVESVVANYSAHDAPLDVVWFDIDHMDRFQDFTLEPTNFPASKVGPFLQQLHANHQYAVNILDPGIHINNSVQAYVQGNAADIWIKDADRETPYLGRVWPGTVHFPDFMQTKAVDWWTQQLANFSSLLNYSGIWIDMNEISNFNQTSNDYTASDQQHYYNNPPYRIVNFQDRLHPLNYKTIPMTSTHLGDDGTVYMEYDVHNLYGMSESIATYKGLVANPPSKRPFVLTRSTAPGSGHWVSMWLGDDNANWQSMRESLTGGLGMTLMGVPHVGADIGGFGGGETNEQLTTRWHAHGTFYTFARNHKDIHSQAWYPYNTTTTLETFQKSISARYTLLPYLNTLFYNVHTQGGTVMRSMAWQFPTDSNTLSISDVFLWGSGVMFAPVVVENATSRAIYFPPTSRFYSFVFNPTISGLFTEVTASGNTTLSNITLTECPTYLVGGTIIPTQPANGSQTAYEARLQNFKLLVPLDRSYQATGSLFLDDGEALNVGQQALVAQYSATSSQITGTVVQNTLAAGGSSPPLTTLTVIGLPGGRQVSSATISINGGAAQQVSSFQQTFNQVDITVSIPVTSSFVINLSYSGSSSSASNSTSGASSQSSLYSYANSRQSFRQLFPSRR